MVFIDLEKAYDSVPRKKLWEALREAGIEDNLIELIKMIYTGSMCQIKIGTKLSKKIQTTKGLLQGCPMSPVLFKIYMDVCLKEWTRKCKKMCIELKEGEFLQHLLFADDQVVITQDGEDANYICNQLYKEYRKWGLEINFDKTEYMTPDLDELYINDIKIKKNRNFTYLGSIIDLDGSSEMEIMKRISMGRKVIGMLNSILWSRNIIHKTKRMIYHSILESMILYGAETWTVQNKHLKRLQAVEMDYWRRAARRSRIEKVRNMEIRRIMNVEENIVDVIEKRRLKWFGHLCRMSDTRIPKMIYDWDMGGKRGKGRPRISWKQNVQQSMIKFGVTIEDAQDRNRWRNIINGV